MINPTFIHTVTVFHQVKNAENLRSAPVWEKMVYGDCYFGSELIKQVNGTSLSMANSFVCRIPAERDDDVAIAPGDVVLKGETEEEIRDVTGMRISDFLNNHQDVSFTVKAVSYNTTLPLCRHVRVSGV